MIHKIANKTYNGHGLYRTDYNPLNLPPYTIRLKYKDGYEPTYTKGSAVQVSETPNIWDYTYNNDSWYRLFYTQATDDSLLEVMGANSTNVTSMESMFHYRTSLSSVNLFDTSKVKSTHGMFFHCWSLSSVPLYDLSKVEQMSYMFSDCKSLTYVPHFDTHNVISMWQTFASTNISAVPHFDFSNVTALGSTFINCFRLSSVPLFDTHNVKTFAGMFSTCSSLTSIPLFDTSNAYDMYAMFYHCDYVKSGALALYQQASTQAVPPSSHSLCFANCGGKDQTGSAELAQIPSDWK